MLYKFYCSIFVILLPTNLLVASQTSKKHLIKITDDNWTDLLKGEWMIAFFSQATWCPACKEMQKPWNAFADWSKDKKVRVAEADVSENAGLSGRFLVTALPTIYHIKDGVFRAYDGPKDKEDFIKFVKDKKWTTVEPLSSWFYPDSTQMSVVAWFFKFSMAARDFHNRLVEKHGIPSWASYGLFGLATLVLGCILGFFMVLIIDCFVPSGKAAKKQRTQQQQQQQQQAQSKKDKKAKKSAQSQEKTEEKEKQTAAKAEKAEKAEKEESKKSDDDFSDLDKAELGSQSEGENDNAQQVRQRKKEEPKKPVANGSPNKKTPSGKK